MYAKINNKVCTESQATVYPRPLKMTNKRYSYRCLERDNCACLFYSPSPAANWRGVLSRKCTQRSKMYVLSEYYSILHQMVHIHYSAITRTLELTFSKPTQVSVTGK